MMTRPLFLLVFPALLLSGCAGVTGEEVARLKQEIVDLKSSQEEMKSRVQDLSTRLVLIREKLDSAKEAERQASSGPLEPPQGLKVVSLSEDDGRKSQEHKSRPAPVAALAPAHKTETQAPQAPPQPPVSDEKKAEAAYSRGQDLYLSGKYGDARKVFTDLAAGFPKSHLADNALYWAGEAYYAEKDFQNAITKFREVAERYPGENKAPDALLKAGYSYLEMGSQESAARVLESLLERYPSTDAAEAGKKTLEKLSGAKKEGSK